MEIILVAFPNIQFLVSFLYFDVSNFDNCPLLVCLPTAIGDLTYMTCSIFKTMNLFFFSHFIPLKILFSCCFFSSIRKKPTVSVPRFFFVFEVFHLPCSKVLHLHFALYRHYALDWCYVVQSLAIKIASDDLASNIQSNS